MSEKWMQKKDVSLSKIIKDAKLKIKKNAEKDFRDVYEKDIQMSNSHWQRIILGVRNFSTFKPITASFLASFIGFFLSFVCILAIAVVIHFLQLDVNSIPLVVNICIAIIAIFAYFLPLIILSNLFPSVQQMVGKYTILSKQAEEIVNQWQQQFSSGKVSMNLTYSFILEDLKSRREVLVTFNTVVGVLLLFSRFLSEEQQKILSKYIDLFLIEFLSNTYSNSMIVILFLIEFVVLYCWVTWRIRDIEELKPFIEDVVKNNSQKIEFELNRL